MAASRLLQQPPQMFPRRAPFGLGREESASRASQDVQSDLVGVVAQQVERVVGER